MPRSCPPTISATRRPGKESRAARVGRTLVDRESSMNVTPSTVPTGGSRLGGGGKPPGAVAARPAQGAQHGAGDQRVAAVVPTRQAKRVHPGRRLVAGLADPLNAWPKEAGPRAEQFAVPVGDRKVRARLGGRRELVAVVPLDAAVPREMVGVKRRDGGDRRGDREVGRRVAGYLV